MKVRFKFTRNERVKFLGHLDIMRTFQRAFMRAGVKMIYTEGFNPHQKMNFAQPLGVGVTSSGEYMDVEIAEGQDLEKIRQGLDAQMGEGFDVLDAGELSEGAEKCMAAVKYASYTITLENDALKDSVSAAKEKFESSTSVKAVKKTKACETEVDLKKMVLNLSAEGERIEILVSAGSENNLKPDLFLSVFFGAVGVEFDRNDVKIHRNGLMADNFTKLEDYQTI